MKKLLIILLFLSGLVVFYAQAPLNFSARLNITNVTGSDPYTLTGVIQDELGLWSAADLNVSQDSIYHLEGSDLLIYRITTISSASGNNFTIIVDDIMNSGLLPSTGSEWAAMAFTTNYQFPVEIGNLASPLKSSINNRFAQRLDDVINGLVVGGGGANLTFTGASSPFTLNSDSGSDVTFVQGSNVTLSRSGNALTIAADSPPITGVNDKVNMFDVTAPSGLVEVDADYTEGTVDNTYDFADKIMKLDNSDGTYKAIETGAYFGNGFVDFVSTQVGIGGEKGFTTALHYGASSLPTTSAFGTTTGTNVTFAPTSTAITESNFQNSQGLIFHNYVDGGTDLQTANIIAAGKDNSGGKSADMAFWVRPNGAAQNWIQPLKIMGSNIILAGGATSGASVGGQLQVNGSNGGQIGYVGGYNDWLMGTVNSPSATFFVSEGGVTRAHIDSGTDDWISGSDIRLKDDVKTLSVLPHINSIRGTSFTLKDSGKKRIGVIAQEMEEHFPEAVSQPDNDKGMKGVSYNAVASIALQGVKELYEENKLLKEQIEELSKRLDKLEKR